MKKHLLCLTLLGMLTFSFTFLQAQITGDRVITSRLSWELKRLYGPHDQGDDPMAQYLQISGDKVVVEMSMTGDIQATRAELGKMGFKELGAYGRLISGLIPIGSLPQLESAKTIVFARAAFKPVRMGSLAGGIGVLSGQGRRPIVQGVTAAAAGSTSSWPVISQGDTAIGSYLARQKYNVGGTGVKIGVISDSWLHILWGDSATWHGELPGPYNPFGDTVNVQTIGDIDWDGADQGKAILEVIHDVAPRSTLAFASGFFSQSIIASNIIKLADAGCKVIGDNEAVYWDAPFFQDDVVARAISQVKARGVTYFTIAGDYGFRSYESEYRPSTYAPFGDSIGTAHNFSAPGTTPRYLQPMTIPKNGVITLDLQWDQNSYSVNGIRSVSTDLDFYLLDKNMQPVGYGGHNNNIATGEPQETFGYQNTTDDTTFYVVIIKRAGTDPGRIKYIISHEARFVQPSDNPIPGLFATTMVGHSRSTDAITVGSAYYYNTPAYGVDPPVVDSFSAKGATMVLLDSLGNHITPQLRQKPDVIGPDAVNTPFFDPDFTTTYDYPMRHGDIAQDADDLPNYFGTAPAMAHAMGTAALMIQAQKDNSLTPDKIKSILTSTAVDMDDPYTSGFDKGFDYATGYGFIDAYKAVGQVIPSNPLIQDLKLQPLCTSDAAHVRSWEIVNPNSSDVEVNWYLIGTTQHGKMTVSPGDTSFTTNVPYFQNFPLPSLLIIYWKNSFDRTRFDLSFGSRAVCGQEQVSASNSDELNAGELGSIAAALRNGVGAGGTVNVAEVSPNPSPGMFRLYLSFDGTQQTQVGLYSAEGKQLQTRVVGQPAGFVDIDATSYRPGVYFLKVQNGGFSKTIKLIRN